MATSRLLRQLASNERREPLLENPGRASAPAEWLAERLRDWPDSDGGVRYVGGDKPCTEAVLTSKTLEALPVSSDDRVDDRADVINRAE